jgi:hypothetical protein
MTDTPNPPSASDAEEPAAATAGPSGAANRHEVERTMARVRGARALIQDGVEHGSRAIERVQIATAARPFAVLERIPYLDGPARGVHQLHDGVVHGVHDLLRLVNRGVGETLDAVLAVAEAVRSGSGPPRPQGPPRPIDRASETTTAPTPERPEGR